MPASDGDAAFIAELPSTRPLAVYSDKKLSALPAAAMA